MLHQDLVIFVNGQLLICFRGRYYVFMIVMVVLKDVIIKPRRMRLIMCGLWKQSCWEYKVLELQLKILFIHARWFESGQTQVEIIKHPASNSTPETSLGTDVTKGSIERKLNGRVKSDVAFYTTSITFSCWYLVLH